MLKKALKKIGIFTIFGIIWLFIFSIPISSNKKIFQFFHYYIVDTTPIHWILEKLRSGFKTTELTTKEVAHKVIDKVDSEVKK